ncbi:competence protein CoiA family protein [Thiohalomonas denitrificans]|uniref:competence protein CoiA family protein n=1 Tax=Thiohalomonas denitrificans TaxID=415747 RepID=UPI0026F1F63B|nr:competence protein CoiA family protein [Thiohalomonas denitrificans]
MGIESLIPFGLDAESGQLVDVGSVKRGNACGCICPSCQTPLVARHGDEKEWHFAHRSQNVHTETRKECKYSFAVSVRLMIRQLSNDGLKFRTPRLERSLPAFSEDSYESADFGYFVTEESLLTLEEVQVGANFSGVTVDVLGLVAGVPFVVFVTYKDRTLPSELKNPSITKCGVVELNVNDVPGLFKQEEKGQYKEVLRRYIEEESNGKAWAYHPREQRLREVATANRKSWLLRQKTEAKAYTSNRRHCQNQVVSMVASSSKESYGSVERSIGNYICVMCKSTWTGTSRICKKCNTHLYATEN